MFQSWVEEVYEECIAPNDANLTGLQMMHSIEIFVEQMMMQMDYIPREAVARAEKKVSPLRISFPLIAHFKRDLLHQQLFVCLEFRAE